MSADLVERLESKADTLKQTAMNSRDTRHIKLLETAAHEITRLRAEIEAKRGEWQPIETVPETIQQLAREWGGASDRQGYIEFGGTITDGRPFVLCRQNSDGWKRFDRWFVLPHVDGPAAKLPSTEGKAP